MSSEELRCSVCDAHLFAVDVFCEECGAPRWANGDGDGRAIDAVTVGAASDRGLVRDRNEDAVHVEAIDDSAFAVVCDGVATTIEARRAAAVAAAVAGRVLGDALRERNHAWDAARATKAAMDAAHQAVVQIALTLGALEDAPACTYVSAMWDGDAISVGSAGDSRAYWIADGNAHQLTDDDSWANEQVSANGLTTAEVMSDPRAHAITRWLGSDAPAGSFAVSCVVPTGPGRVVVCSDGLWRYASDPEELALLVTSLPASTPAVAVASALIRTALAAGGHDNVTAAVLDVRPSHCQTSNEEAP